jgi:hypothetical protein
VSLSILYNLCGRFSPKIALYTAIWVSGDGEVTKKPGCDCLADIH